MKLRLIEQFEQRARSAPDTPVLWQVDSPAMPGRTVTRGALAASVSALSARLASVIPPGGIVLISSPNRPEFIAAFLATLAAGLKAFPVSPELAAPELLSAAERTSAAALIGTTASIDFLRDRVPLTIPIDEIDNAVPATSPARSHDTGGLLLLSSGTTGRPKIVFRDARSLDAVSEAMATAIGFRETDHVLACVPLAHSYGIEHGLLAPLWAGTSVHLAQGFELRTVQHELAASNISIFPGVPFMFEMLARHSRDDAAFPALRRAYSAGGPLPASVAEAFHTRFNVPVTQLYGATEIGSVTYADPDLLGFDPASVGRPMKGVAIRILLTDAPDTDHPLPAGEQGHVAIAAASMLNGYLGDESIPTTNGFFLTGDLGKLDTFDNLTITGRLKLLIDVGGLKVNPLEVEDVLVQHPGVGACVVTPMRVSDTVSRLKAILTPRAGTPAPTPESLRAFARERLAGYKVPRLFEIRESLPTSPTGKILRHQVEA